MENKKLLTKAEASDIMRISLAMLNRLLAQQRIPYIKLGARVLIEQKDIDAYLEQCRVETTPKGTIVIS